MRVDISKIVPMHLHLLCHMHIKHGMRYQIRNEKKMEKKIIKRKIIEGMNREEKWICF